MKKSEALKKIDSLIEGYEKNLKELSDILGDTVKHKHMFNDIKYCVDNIQYNLDMLLELKREIEGENEEEKKEAFKIYDMACPECEVEYDFDWDEEKKDKKEED